MYDLNYRSYVDTPYAESEIYQHTLQTYTDVTINEQYPVRIYFTTRFSNSSIFRNLTDLNLKFNPYEFRNILQQKINAVLDRQNYFADTLSNLRQKIAYCNELLSNLKKNTPKVNQLQEIIHQREQLYYKIDSAKEKVVIQSTKINADSIQSLLNKVSTTSLSRKQVKQLSGVASETQATFQDKTHPAFLQNRKQQADSLKQIADSLQKKYSAFLQQVARLNEARKTNIAGIKDPRRLQKVLNEAGIPDSVLPKGYKTLWGLQSLSLGRTFIDYSELSARNISITGIEVNYTSGLSYTIATGFMDYRFREYIVGKNSMLPRQYLNIARIGKVTGSRSLLLTLFNGKRQLFNSETLTGANQPNYNLYGFTVELKQEIARNIWLTGEVAKSSVPYYATRQEKSIAGTAFDFSSRDNEAYAMKMQAGFPATNTKLTGSIRRIGANFQSFSIFTTGAAQTEWQTRLDQYLFKKQLLLVAGIRTNDFSNPFVDRTYKTKATFATLQATYRRKKWPVLSAGFYPSSQLVKLGDQRFTESRFYTLNGNASYFYAIRGRQMTTSFVYTRFYNHSADSGFVYYNSRNMLFSQAVFGKIFNWQGNISLTANNEYNLYVAEAGTSIHLTKFLTAGGGLKYNYQTVFEKKQLGYSASMTIKIKPLGNFQWVMDKGFIAGSGKQLVANNITRFNYFKSF